jgi:hypothetical protein
MSIRDDLQSAAVIVATGQAFKLAKKGVVSGLEKIQQRKAAKAMKSDTGSAGLSYMLSLGLSKVPRFGDSEFVKSMSNGLRVGALTILGNSVLTKMLGTDDKKEDEITEKSEE